MDSNASGNAESRKKCREMGWTCVCLYVAIVVTAMANHKLSPRLGNLGLGLILLIGCSYAYTLGSLVVTAIHPNLKAIALIFGLTIGFDGVATLTEKWMLPHTDNVQEDAWDARDL